jgi:hypothetical protein
MIAQEIQRVFEAASGATHLAWALEIFLSERNTVDTGIASGYRKCAFRDLVEDCGGLNGLATPDLYTGEVSWQTSV